MKLLRTLSDFLAAETAGGMVMIFAALLALALANSPWDTHYYALITHPLLPGMNASHFIADILMAIFFFLVGMELKHEMTDGALAAPGQKTLPLFAALGGVITPAIIYLAITHTIPEYRAGWAIPTATDIAFALCVLRLIGKTIPHSAKMFLLAIAIYDDLAAILIIAFFYSAGLALLPLAAALVITAILWLLNRLHIDRAWPYLLLGMALWFAIYHGGIHPTVAGVITGLLIPRRRRDGTALLTDLLAHLHPYVAFAILPLFAFTHAGLDMRDLHLNDLFAQLPLAIAAGLVLGKPIGIMGATWAATRWTSATIPAGMGWPIVGGIAILAGIGFTMSLFLGGLAFSASLQPAVTLGVLGGSLLSALLGSLWLRARRP